MIESREKIDKKYKWNLEKIYKTNEDFIEELEYITKKQEDIVKYKGIILKSSENLYNLLKDMNDYDMILSKLYVYAKMRLDEDSNKNIYKDYVGRIENTLTRFSTLTSFIQPELLNSDYELVLKYILENDKLETYKKLLQDIYRYKSHTLTNKEEHILASLSKVLNLSEQTAYYLRNADMKFGKIIDENGKKQELTDSNYSIYIKSKNRKVRKSAFKEMFKTYKSLVNTYASLLGGTVELNNETAKLRKYNSSLEMSLYNDDIDVELYDKLIKNVHKGLPFLFKYYKLKKQVLNVNELHIYDVYAELSEKSDKKYEYEEAKKIIKKALSVFGDEYISIIDKAFSENWIDVFENKGKKSGAYSWGAYTTDPYILTNYNYDYNSVSTLAHELGHSVHSYLSNHNNTYHESGYPIFLAEIASTVNELLLAYYILDNTDDINEKKYIISNMLELYRATIYRQTMFAEFEKEIHEKNMQGLVLTSETLSDIYYDKIKTYFAKNIKIDEEIKYEWARIPHFYDSFYVYKYATGLSIASYIVKRIRSNDTEFKNKYINLLKSGGKDYPLELLKKCDIDVLNDNIVYEALESFNELIDKEYVYEKRLL